MPAPGITSSFCLVSSNDGTIPISTAPDARRSANSEGTRNSKSKNPRWGPWVMPQTRGEVFRKLTAHTRGRMGEESGNFQVYQTPLTISEVRVRSPGTGLCAHHVTRLVFSGLGPPRRLG